MSAQEIEHILRRLAVLEERSLATHDAVVRLEAKLNTLTIPGNAPSCVVHGNAISDLELQMTTVTTRLDALDNFKVKITAICTTVGVIGSVIGSIFTVIADALLKHYTFIK